MLRRPLACLLLLWYLPACMTWHVSEGVNVKQLIETEHPKIVRLTLTGGSQLFLRQPRIVAGDSVSGVRKGTTSSIAVSDVTQVAIQKQSDARTIALGFAIVSVFAVVAAVRISQAN
jgi:hypothetical protein